MSYWSYFIVTSDSGESLWDRGRSVFLPLSFFDCLSAAGLSGFPPLSGGIPAADCTFLVSEPPLSFLPYITS